MESQSQSFRVFAMQNPLPPFDAFDTTKDYDCRPARSHDYAHVTQQQQWNNGGNSPQLFDSQAAGDSTTTAMPGHHIPMTPFGDTTTKDYSYGTGDYTTLHSAMTTTLGDADYLPSGTEDNIYMTQQQSRRDTSKLFPPQPVRGSMLFQPQAVGGSTTATAQTYHLQAVGGSPAGTEDNIYMTQQQKNDRNTPQQLFHPHAVEGLISNAQLFHSQAVGVTTPLPGNTHTSETFPPQAVGSSTTTITLPGNNTTLQTPTMTPITPATKGVSGSGVQPTLQNIVATVNLGCKLDLKLIIQKARNAEYNPKRFGAVIMRIREPRTTALIFSSGKMVCTGATSEEQSRLAARKFARAVQKLGFPAKFLDFKIQNMVGSCDVKFPVRLETLFVRHQQFSQYEPESFPGLVYKMIEPRVNLLIFVSGKVVLTGAKAREEINQAFENIYPILKSFEKSEYRPIANK